MEGNLAQKQRVCFLLKRPGKELVNEAGAEENEIDECGRGPEEVRERMRRAFKERA